MATLRRTERVACETCGSSHPAVYRGHQCLICGSAIAAAGRRQDGGGAAAERRTRKKAEEQFTARLAALELERDKLRSALQAARKQQNFVYVSDYEWYVELAAKGMAQRDNFPMPPSVTTPEGFYEIMAGAALDGLGFRGLLERLARAEEELGRIQEALRLADATTETARHRATTE